MLDETCAVETKLVERNEPYVYAKLKQDELVQEYAAKYGFPYVVLRPGAVYGPGQKAEITHRVGIGTFGIFLHLGGRNRIPFTHVRNCAEAIALAGTAPGVDGEVFNVNADTVAESLAVALRAQKLIFLTGAPGVLRDRTDPSTLVTFADPDDLAGLMANGVLSGGMRPKVEACIRAATGGVERTHIIDGRAPDALLLEVFTDAGCGTMIVGRKEKATYLGVDLAG